MLDPKDIVSGVLRNGSSPKYLKILAELNNCTVEDVEKTLEQNGFHKVNGVWTRLKPEDFKSLSVTDLKSDVKSVDEIKDKVNKVKGGKGMSKKLTKVQEKEIVKKYQSNNVTYSDLAKEYGVSSWTIGNVVRAAGGSALDIKRSVDCKAAEIKDISGKDKSGKDVPRKSSCRSAEPEDLVISSVLLECMDAEAIKGMYKTVKDNIERKEKELAGLNKVKKVIEKFL